MHPLQERGGGQKTTVGWSHPPCTSSALTGGGDGWGGGWGGRPAAHRTREEAEGGSMGAAAGAPLEESRGEQAAEVLTGPRRVPDHQSGPRSEPEVSQN